MSRLHVSELSDAEISAVFSTAVEEAVARAQGAGHHVPTMSTPAAVLIERAEARIEEVAERLKEESRDRLGCLQAGVKPARNQKSA
jgi:ribosomal protein L12E/L44/L45/RPP1/RPP2